ncbi:MAG TPA: AraC family transcriptional regulator [Candidatus Sulfotelmatobacter sp.]|nr:AraC family transcriptional regulator [Candidatus Sulfotelmatobacter sp.]
MLLTIVPLYRLIFVASHAQPGKVLRGGEFYSPVRARLTADDVVLSELCQPIARSISRHEHELAYVTIVLQGDYGEGDHGKLDHLRPFTAVFNPVGASHSTVIGPCGASMFTIEFRNQRIRALGLRLPEQTSTDYGAGAMLWPGLRLFSAFKSRNESCVLEGHVFELLAAIASPDQSMAKMPPRWLMRVKERLHGEFRNRLRMGDLAREAGVHPVHLARAFRRFEKCTPGEYVQQLQLRAACDLLRKPEWPLANIAAECGFADQSHFTRMFRRMAATTPLRFRQAILPRAAET